MKPEYNFKQSERGKFYRPGAILRVPIYLEPDVLAVLSAKAKEEGVEIDSIVNDMLKRDIGIIETAG